MVVTIQSVSTPAGTIASTDTPEFICYISGDALAVCVVIDGQLFQLDRDHNVSGKYSRNIPASLIQEQTDTTVHYVAFDADPSIAIDSSTSITVEQSDYPDPVEFVKNFIVSNFNRNRAGNVALPAVKSITEVKRWDDDLVYIIELKRLREAKGIASRYKTIRYPLEICIQSKRKDWALSILEEVKHIFEENYNNLGSIHFDYVTFRDEGKNASTRSSNIWRYIYSIELVKEWKPIAGGV